MIGGAYLCYEGVEKIAEVIMPNYTHSREAHLGTVAFNPRTLEDEKVAGAIKTDFILSAEIVAITLAAIPVESILTQAFVLSLVGIGITVAVYGVVALIVKADDVGMALAKNQQRSVAGVTIRALGRTLVLAMPIFLTILSAVGTAAMIWVGGGYPLARRRAIWPRFNRHGRRGRCSRPAIGFRGAQMGNDGGHIRFCGIVDWRGRNSGS